MTDNNMNRYLDELNDWLRIPSISADPNHKGDVERGATWLADHLGKIGGEEVTIHPTKGHPIVTARVGNDPNKPTVLVYGHYDVQPSTPDEKWTTPAFEPTIRDDKLYARGVADDKGQVFLHLKAVEEMGKDAPCNIIFLIEGEEEVGSPNLAPFIETHQEMLRCDAVLVSDTHMIASDTPSLTVSLRGLSYAQINLKGPNRDLHSGTYGGAVHNPAEALVKMLSKFHDKDGQVTIPGFYDNVKKYSAAERTELNKVPFNLEEYKKDLGIADVKGEENYTTVERTGIRPTFEINGMWSGYTGAGAKTIIPSTAHAKVSMRLVDNQDPKDIFEKFERYVKTITPETVEVEVENLHGGNGAATSTSSTAYKAAAAAMTTIWGKEPVPTYEGGSIPVVADFKRILRKDVVLMGFGLNSDMIHSPNENFTVSHIPKGIETIKQFHSEFSKLKR